MAGVDPIGDILANRGEQEFWSGTLRDLAMTLGALPEQLQRRKAAQSQAEIRALQLQEAQRKVQDLKALDEAFAQPGGRAEILKRVPGHLRADIEKRFADADESDAKRRKAQEDVRVAEDETIARVMSGIKAHGYSPEAAQLAISTLKSYYGDDPKRMQQISQWEAMLHQNPSPDFIRKTVDALSVGSKAQKAESDAAKAAADIAKTEAETTLKGMEAEGSLPIQPTDKARMDAEAARAAATQAAAEAQRAEAARHNRATEANAAGQLGVARAREAREAAKPAGSDKPPTGAQRRALGFFNRAKQADDDVQDLESDISKMSAASSAWMKYAPNLAQTETGQKYNQAQRAFTEARLRKDSGAAIPEHEFENDRKTYFAEPGDSAAVLEQKRRARAALIASLGSEAGSSALREFYGDEGDSLVQSYREKAAKAQAKAAPKATLSIADVQAIALATGKTYAEAKKYAESQGHIVK